MEWQEISVTTTETAMEAVADIFYKVGAAGVVIEDPRVIDAYLKEKKWDYYELPLESLEAESVVVKGYLPVDERLPRLLATIRESLDKLQQYFDDYRAEITLEKVREQDWANAWKAYYKPIKVSERIVIKPTWEHYRPGEDEIIIELDPGMAFGTGTHPTTVMCIRALEKYLVEGQKVIDVGTGSAVLAITAAKLGAGRVLALDLDPLAVKVAASNVALNKVDDVVRVSPGNLLIGIEEQADLIVANIIADIILDLSSQVREHLTGGGVFIASGIIEQRYDEVRNHLRALKLDVLETLNEDDWVAVVARKV
ncbi:MAG: 50S ribosomal protein L11 methyltransferase [Thermoanaerobacteraceae bacterium]|nr:50S ribosomal protein L11 methyltransferase [Thermoanaerobacteraceae bacterium]